MHTSLHPDLKEREALREAERIVRTCVHCGFCNATCPTYQLLGDELDGPRGRIYLIKGLLEDNALSRRALLHLDRCLSCRGCETTCPSGVSYGRMLDAGREHAERLVRRSLPTRLERALLSTIVPHPARFRVALAVARSVRWLLPRAVAEQIPARVPREDVPAQSHSRQVLLLDGCVQEAATPATNAALARLLDRLAISARFAPNAGCCGALDHHLADPAAARRHMRRLIDRCWPFIEEGVEAIISSASGCGVHLKEYGYLFRDDPLYSARAERVAEAIEDVSEFLARELSEVEPVADAPVVAWHPPCSLQHGQGIVGVVEGLLKGLGVELTDTPEGHLCCGSAGSYSLLQPELATDLRTRKLANLQKEHPELIVTANVGCQLYLGGASETPVLHWVELVEGLLRP